MYTNALKFILYSIPGILIAITLHEFTRAAVSNALGDTLPKREGRLTINPIKHFEPIGFILMLATGGFGWGKPVNTSALYYKNRKKDTLLTAIIPMIVNLMAGFVFTLFTYLASKGGFYELGWILQRTAIYNIALTIYNLVPFTPMDGLKILSIAIPSNQYFKYLQYEKIVQMLFMLLLFMNYITVFFDIIIQQIYRFFEFIIFLIG